MKPFGQRMIKYGIPRRPSRRYLDLRITDELAYNLWGLCGDGTFYVDRRRKSCTIHLNCRDHDFANEFACRLSSVLQRPISVRYSAKERKYYVTA